MGRTPRCSSASRPRKTATGSAAVFAHELLRGEGERSSPSSTTGATAAARDNPCAGRGKGDRRPPRRSAAAPRCRRRERWPSASTCRARPPRSRLRISAQSELHPASVPTPRASAASPSRSGRAGAHQRALPTPCTGASAAAASAGAVEAELERGGAGLGEEPPADAHLALRFESPSPTSGRRIGRRNREPVRRPRTAGARARRRPRPPVAGRRARPSRRSRALRMSLRPRSELELGERAAPRSRMRSHQPPPVTVPTSVGAVQSSVARRARRSRRKGPSARPAGCPLSASP